MPELPFDIEVERTGGRGAVRFFAIVDGVKVAFGKYIPGDTVKRRKLADEWATNEALHNGSPLHASDIARELELAEIDATDEPEDSEVPEKDADEGVEAPSFVDKDFIIELAWNYEVHQPDFIRYDRGSHEITRSDRIQIGGLWLRPPVCWNGVVTPGGTVAGLVFVPSEHDETGLDETHLRESVETFIRRYVELPGEATQLVVEYILLSWIHDGFDEVPYLAFRTSDFGRGKSRALETVGSICYRPILCGGGSTAAAVLRLVHGFRGTLVCDEFDQRDTELANEVTKILNQGFQRNRPLIKCDGEKNTPTAFWVFGPKLFALRKGFKDDATESRIISIRMEQRTRKDIPISLPRATFDAEALALRNRLLAWRFANLGKLVVNPDHADPNLEDRLNQIGLPLMAVAGTTAGRRRVVEALKQQQRRVQDDKGESVEAAVFEIALDLAGIGGIVRPKRIACEINRRRALDQGIETDRLKDAIKPEKVGRVLRKDLELTRLPKDRDGVSYRMDSARVEQLRTRFGMVPSEPSQPSNRHASHQPSHKNSLFDTVNGDCDGCDRCDGSTGQPGAPSQNDTEPSRTGESGDEIPDGWTSDEWADVLEAERAE